MGSRLVSGATFPWRSNPGVALIGQRLNKPIQSATASSLFNVLGEKLSSSRIFAS